MQVTKLTSPADTSIPAGHQLSEKQLYDELNYRRSEKLTKKMLAAGLITPDECDWKFRSIGAPIPKWAVL